MKFRKFNAFKDASWTKISILMLKYPTGCPKKNLALGKHLKIATNGFNMYIFYVKKGKLGPNPSRPLKGHP